MENVKISTLIPMLIFYGAYITKAILLKKQGIRVNRLTIGHKPWHTRLLEVVLIAVTYGMAILQCVGVLGLLPTFHIGLRNEMIGLMVALIGCVCIICAVIAMKNSWRAGIDSLQKTELRTDGILRWSRNPAFLSFDLFYIGVVLMLPNVFLLIFVAIAFVVFHLQIFGRREVSLYKFWSRLHIL